MWCAQRCKPPISSTLLQTMKTSRGACSAVPVGTMGAPLSEVTVHDGARGGPAVVLAEPLGERAARRRVRGPGGVQVRECGDQLVLGPGDRAGRVLLQVEVAGG